MAKKWRIPFEEFAANLPTIFERLREGDETLLVETDEETIVVHRRDLVDAEERASTTAKPSADDMEAFRAAAGSWSDVDTDRLLADIYADRERLSNRPAVNL